MDAVQRSNTPLETRRGLLRRSLLGATGVGLTALLVACGDDDDDEGINEPTGKGAEDPGEEPGLETEAGFDASDDDDDDDEEDDDGTPEDDD